MVHWEMGTSTGTQYTTVSQEIISLAIRTSFSKAPKMVEEFNSELVDLGTVPKTTRASDALIPHKSVRTLRISTERHRVWIEVPESMSCMS
jgi:hypothetical protein